MRWKSFADDELIVLLQSLAADSSLPEPEARAVSRLKAELRQELGMRVGRTAHA